ncbi:efflux RND transporter periplasmic adaptor subunit [Microbulbifer hainanensis]|uniref:efflux RND transporter periplasmic adaptor subunit n=1 Tax=Microbulbifer hainanensis TaxID=2735675 RepID=UPI0018679583|nr:efflux RND transporter periplasmic adaptor subunit [Microbulbifer hainanensis]
MKRLPMTALGLVIVLTACSGSDPEPLLYEVRISRAPVLVAAEGELEAASATAIQAPVSGPPKYIAWLAPEYSEVHKGDVIVRFDGEAMQRDRRWTKGDLDIAREDMREKQGHLDTEQLGITLDSSQVQIEKAFAERFSVEDNLLKSRLEMLDDLLDIEFLNSKLDYLDWKNTRFATSAEGEVQVLTVQEDKYEAKIERLDKGLAALEIVAPHDGILTYEANWRGDKPQVGQQIWPGRKVGDLPDVSVMQAKLHVLDREAVGLAKGQAVDIWIEALPGQHFAASVDSISAAPASVERGNPQKYYEVIARFQEQHPQLFKLGRGVGASIQVKGGEERLEIPLQSLFHSTSGPYVYVYSGGDFRRRPVTLGKATPTHIEITAGLSVGEKIALYDVANIALSDKEGNSNG